MFFQHNVSLYICLFRIDLVRNTLKSNERLGQEGNKNADNESCNSVLDSVSFLPLPYLNFLLKLVISEEYITHQDSRTAPTISIHSFDAEISSLSQSMLEPCVRHRTFTSRHLKGGSNIRSKIRKPTIYFTQNDSKAVFTWRNTLKDADFVISEEISEPGYLRLVPVKPAVWEGCHLALVEDTIYLKQTIASCKPFTTLSLIASTATIGFSCLWPAKAEEWITRKRQNNLPSSADIERIVSLGCKIVPATIGNDLEWEYSFHTNERVFFTGIITKEQRNLLLLLTSIIDHLHDLNNIEYDDILTSVYLYACEEIPNITWLENPSFCFCKIIEMIIDGLREKFLPNYFMRCKNILKGRSHIDLERLLEPLEILRSNPLSCLHFLFDGYEYSGTEFGIIFNAIICDFRAVGSETEITQRFEKFVVNFPQRKSDMRDPDQDVYQNERMTQVHHGMNSCKVLSLFEQIFASFEPVKMWSALLTMSRMMGQPLTQLISYQHESVNSVEIFGPDFAALFGDIQIPKTCSYGINMICFVSSFAKLIFVIWPLDKAMAVGLRYFLLHKAHETQSVLPDLNDLSHFSVQEQCMSIMMFLSLYVVFVTDLYRLLYNVAVRLHETDLLVDMIGPLERFCCLIGTPNQYEVLADFCQLIGDDNETRQARSRALRA
ncbi:hypothetical protein ACJMK2_024801 [Sinanodonta woodiana]|uniref:Uncharacterized protein n=1 Tax=Sinanodonta woodiana TaxID=1069815 RepID=A0ABD3XGE3_SINWO